MMVVVGYFSDVLACAANFELGDIQVMNEIIAPVSTVFVIAV